MFNMYHVHYDRIETRHDASLEQFWISFVCIQNDLHDILPRLFYIYNYSLLVVQTFLQRVVEHCDFLAFRKFVPLTK